MVVRDDNGNIVDINQTSTTQLYEHHVKATSRIQQATVSLSLSYLRKLFNCGKMFLLFTVEL
jgi:dedicator of cytokinesis protein 1